MEILLSDLMHTLARVCTTSSGFLSGGSKSYSARGRDTSKELFHRRRMERRLSVQHSQGRMERTKNTHKNQMKSASFLFCGKVISQTQTLTFSPGCLRSCYSQRLSSADACAARVDTLRALTQAWETINIKRK
jgi:hypothetical protein